MTNPDTDAILTALPAPHEKGLTLSALAERAGIPAWKARCAIAVLRSIGPARVEEVAQKHGNRSLEPTYRRAA